MRNYWTQRGVVSRWQYFLVYVLIVMAGVVGFARIQDQSSQIHRTALVAQKSARQTTKALCILRGDLESRVSQSQRFLKEHPNGVAHIPAATIQMSISGQKRTIKALSILRC